MKLDDRGKRSVSLREGLERAFSESDKSDNDKTGGQKLTPSSIDTPSFLMCYPLSVQDIPKPKANNALMNKKEAPYNYKKAFKQWEELYRAIINGGGFVNTLQHEYPPLQDLPFVANLGIYLPHLKPDSVIISNFKSQPRKGEDDVGFKWFKENNYAVSQPSTHWEGEADLKWISKNIYVGGYGIRTDEKSFDWMMDKFGMEIIKIKMSDEKLYHFDCMFFPITDKLALVSTSAFQSSDLKKIENRMNVINVPKEYKYDGWTNSVKIGNKILCGHLPDPKSTKTHGDILRKLGYTPIDIDLSEFAKSGGDLSCLIFNINYRGR